MDITNNRKHYFRLAISFPIASIVAGAVLIRSDFDLLVIMPAIIVSFSLSSVVIARSIDQPAGAAERTMSDNSWRQSLPENRSFLKWSLISLAAGVALSLVHRFLSTASS